MRPPPARRYVRRTVLLVGEGDAELAFIKHLKSLYGTRNNSLAVTVKNARGKGALGVVDFAIRQSRNAVYNVKAALLDTDTDWNKKTEAVAQKAKVQVVASHPCIKAMLLALNGELTQNLSSAKYKQVFAKRFGAEAHDHNVYAKHFPLELLNRAKGDSQPLAQLLALLDAGDDDVKGAGRLATSS